jgi:hypothetical protein
VFQVILAPTLVTFDDDIEVMMSRGEPPPPFRPCCVQAGPVAMTAHHSQKMTPVATEKSIHEHVSTFHKTFFDAAAMRKAAPLVVIRCNEGDGYRVVRASARLLSNKCRVYMSAL